jgi:hypothetical protein
LFYILFYFPIFIFLFRASFFILFSFYVFSFLFFILYILYFLFSYYISLMYVVRSSCENTRAITCVGARSAAAESPPPASAYSSPLAVAAPWLIRSPSRPSLLFVWE